MVATRTYLKFDHKRVDPTFRKRSLASEPFISPEIFLYIPNLGPQLYIQLYTTIALFSMVVSEKRIKVGIQLIACKL